MFFVIFPSASFSSVDKISFLDIISLIQFIFFRCLIKFNIEINVTQYITTNPNHSIIASDTVIHTPFLAYKIMDVYQDYLIFSEQE